MRGPDPVGVAARHALRRSPGAAVLTLVGAVVSTCFVVYSVAFYRQVTAGTSPTPAAAR